MENINAVVVRWFPERHFGFLKYADGEIFTHQFNVEYDSIQSGDRVTFVMGTFKNRATALNVKLLKSAAPTALESATQVVTPAKEPRQ